MQCSIFPKVPHYHIQIYNIFFYEILYQKTPICRLTNQNDPNTMTDGNYIEVSTPSEPLMNGVVYDGRVFVCSSERMWQVVPDGNGRFIPTEVANSKGIVGPHAITVDKLIYLFSKDGINVSEGGQPTSLTDATMAELFPHDGIVGTNIGDMKAVNLEDDSRNRLMAYSGRLYCDHLDIEGNAQTLVFDLQAGAWVLDRYGDGGVVARYGIRGQRPMEYGMVCATETMVGRLDNPNPVDYDSPNAFEWQTLAFGAEDRRAEKLWGDWILNGQFTAGDAITVEFGEDSYSTPISTKTINIPTTGRHRIHGDFPIDFLAVDVAAKISVISESKFEIYNWEPSLLERPEKTILRSTDWDDVGMPGSKMIQGCYIEADTGGLDRVVKVVGDGGVVIHTLTINHAGQQRRVYSFPIIQPTILEIGRASCRERV